MMDNGRERVDRRPASFYGVSAVSSTGDSPTPAW